MYVMYLCNNACFVYLSYFVGTSYLSEWFLDNIWLGTMYAAPPDGSRRILGKLNRESLLEERSTQLLFYILKSDRCVKPSLVRLWFWTEGFVVRPHALPCSAICTQTYMGIPRHTSRLADNLCRSTSFLGFMLIWHAPEFYQMCLPCTGMLFTSCSQLVDYTTKYEYLTWFTHQFFYYYHSLFAKSCPYSVEHEILINVFVRAKWSFDTRLTDDRLIVQSRACRLHSLIPYFRS